MISLAQSGIGINIDFKPIEIEFVFVHVQGVTHVIAQMTAFSDNQSKGLHSPQGHSLDRRAMVAPIAADRVT